MDKVTVVDFDRCRIEINSHLLEYSQVFSASSYRTAMEYALDDFTKAMEKNGSDLEKRELKLMAKKVKFAETEDALLKLIYKGQLNANLVLADFKVKAHSTRLNKASV